MTTLNEQKRETSVEAQYDALRSSAVLVDRSERFRYTFGGPKAREVLAGLVTNDVLALREGAGCYAAALSPKGKIIADARLFVLPDHVLVDVPPLASPGWWAMIRKYVNPRLSRYDDVSTSLADLSVFGPEAWRFVSRALGVEPATLVALNAYDHLPATAWGGDCLVARIPDLGSIPGYSLFLPHAAREVAWHALQEAGAAPIGTEAYNIARIESGRPEWGVEMDENTIPQEANFDELNAISYTKGCYTGQETVARIHFRGHVNRHLRGVRFGDVSTLPSRSELFGAEEKVVGDLRSVANSPRLGGVGIAMVRREVPVNCEIAVRQNGAEWRATVVALPFPE